MNFRNQIILTGNLGTDPVFVRNEREGGAIVRLSLAVSEYRYNSEDKTYTRTHTNWIPIKIFGALASKAGESLRNGDLITISGTLRSSAFESKGAKQTKIEVVAIDILKAETLPRTNKEALEDLTSQITKRTMSQVSGVNEESEESLEK